VWENKRRTRDNDKRIIVDHHVTNAFTSIESNSRFRSRGSVGDIRALTRMSQYSIHSFIYVFLDYHSITLLFYHHTLLSSYVDYLISTYIIFGYDVSTFYFTSPNFLTEVETVSTSTLFSCSLLIPS